MRLSQTATSDAHELGLGTQGFDVRAAGVTHAAAQTPDQLKYHIGDRPLVGDASFNAFGNELASGACLILEVAVCGPFFHGSQGAHAPYSFEAAAFEQKAF